MTDPPEESSSRAWLVVPPLAGLAWCAMHLAIHLPRGWPVLRDDEMAVLLPAVTLADGHPLGAVVGSLQGWELGSYVVAWFVACFVRAGLAPVLAVKVVAMIHAASMVVVASWLAGRITSGSRWVAAGGAGLLLSVGWLHSHWNQAGLRGTTPDSLPFHIAAVAVVVAGSRPRVSAAAGGVLAGIALLFTPVALVTIGATFVLVLTRSTGRERLVCAGLTVAGAVLPVVLFAAVVPEGMAATGHFIATHLALLGVPMADGGMPGVGSGLPVAERLLTLLGRVGGHMEGEAQRGAFQLREVALPVLSWVVVATPVVALVRTVRARRLDDDSRVAAAAAITAVGVLTVPPGDWWIFPSAYQYWSVATMFGVVVLASLLGQAWMVERWRGPGRATVAVLLTVAAVPLIDAPQLITRSAPTAATEMVNTGSERLDPRPDHPDHEVFLVYRAALSQRGRRALAQGYGARLVDTDRFTIDGRPDLPRDLEAAEVRALLAGAGCRFAEMERPVEPFFGQSFGRGHALCADPGVPPLGEPLPPRHSRAALEDFVGTEGSLWLRR